MKYYKVVRNTEDGYISVIACGSEAVEYSKGKPTKARFGKLFVFTSLEQAKAWAKACAVGGYEIWEVAVTKPEPAPSRIRNIYSELVKDCWLRKRYKVLTSKDYGWDTPPDTMIVNSVEHIETVLTLNMCE
jgi:hypothetical protein